MAAGAVTAGLKISYRRRSCDQSDQKEGHTASAENASLLPCMLLHQDGSTHERVPITGGY